jgi:5-methylcytosine-specific restriction endonuclease McrA
MRSVQRGVAPKIYKDYKAARNDLTGRLGWFCSYCEMPVHNMIEVEHIQPVANGGNELDWDNFLLACRYCNGNKRDNSRATGYFSIMRLERFIKPSSNAPNNLST